MEIELKYRIPSEDVAEEIWKDKTFFHLEEEGSREERCFDAKYYDTEDRDLYKNEIAYRVRKEGNSWVASLKWKGHTEGALHVREELNVSVECDKPAPEVFHGSEIGEHLLEVIDGKPLNCLLETRFHRKRFRIDTGRGIYELSIDDGWILTQNGQERILEAEVELFSGDTEELSDLGAKMCEKYGLVKEERSKYARGLELIEKNI